MKKILQLLLPVALLLTQAQAQITIQSDQISLVGNFAIQSRDTLPDAPIVPGGSGEQTWNFSTLKNQDRDSLAFYEVGDTPFSALFPGTNVAATLDSIAYIYFEKTDNYLRTHGSYGTLNYDPFVVTSAYRYDPPQTIIRFPMELNNAYSEEVVATIQITGATLGLPYDSIRAVTRTQRSVLVDAFGELTTPSGFYQTLRSTEVEISRDSAFVQSNGIWFPLQGSEFPDTITLYNWWTNQNGLGFPVVQLEVNGGGETKATWLFDFVSGTDDPAKLLKVNVSPNPTSDFLKVELPEAFDGSLEVFDMNGRRQIALSAVAGSESVDVQSLVNGSYVLVLKDKNGGLVGFERFAVVR